MATKRIKDLAARTGSAVSSDVFAIGVTSPDVDRKITLGNVLAGLGIASSAVGSLPTPTPTYPDKVMMYATDGRKVGEGAGDGTGVLVQWDSGGSVWVAVDSGEAVAA